MADPALKVIANDSAIRRPLRHPRFLETLTFHGRLELARDAPIEERFAAIAKDLALGIEGTLYSLGDAFRSLGGSREQTIVNHEETLYFSVCAVVVLILAVSGVENPDHLADATIARALSLRKGNTASILEFRSRFEQYNKSFWQFFAEPSDYEELLTAALKRIVGQANALDATVFGGYFVILLVDAGKAINEAAWAYKVTPRRHSE